MANQNLTKAKRAKKDEFYTRWEEIEKEVNAYIEYNKDVFRNKTILLPADDPFESNFFKYFAVHFNDYGLKKLIATSYDSSPVVNQQLSLFGDEEEEKKTGKAYKIELTHVEDFDHDGVFNIKDVENFLLSEKMKLNSSVGSNVLSYLHGDDKYVPGDFRSKEVTSLRDESDIIITNPPFSLFREFIKWVNPKEKVLLVIGRFNAVTYKGIFPLLQENIMWLGVPFQSGNAYFYLPKEADTSRFAKGVYDPENNTVKFRNVCWFTNLDHGRRHAPLSLMSFADNIKFSKHKQIKGHEYLKYDNYDAIEVPFTGAIPTDYDGIMGVPISFLDKYNPDQFVIEGLAAGNSRKTGLYGDVKYTPNKLDRGGCGVVQGERKYARILIKKKE